jgi:hypothetical protein
MATTDLSISSAASSSVLARGITGVIQLGSGMATGTVAVTGTVTVGMDTVMGTVTVGMDTVMGTVTAGMDTVMGTIMADMRTGGAMPVDTTATTADSVVDKPSAGARCMAAAASMVEADSTAADADKRQFC